MKGPPKKYKNRVSSSFSTEAYLLTEAKKRKLDINKIITDALKKALKSGSQTQNRFFYTYSQ